jgi:hypothetical protein
MKPESDFSYSEAPVENSSALSEHSLHLPFALLSSAIAVLMIAQTITTFKQRSALQEGAVQLTETIKKREIIVKQSMDIETKLKDLIVDLLILSRTDDDAKKIVSKYGIQQNGQASPPPAPAK